MSTKVTLVRVQLKLKGPWHIGGFRNQEEQIQQPILLDQRDGGPYLPASSLMGGLRAHLMGLDPARATYWLGPEPEDMPRSGQRRAGDDGEGLASRLWGLGVVLGDGHALSSHGSTAIDPSRGAAKTNTLRTVDVASGGEATWYLQADGWLEDDLLSGLATWRPVVGRGRSIGQGAATVRGVEALQLDLSLDAHLTWWLTERSQWLDGGDSPDSLRQSDFGREANDIVRTQDWCHKRQWRAVDAVAVGSGQKEVADPTARTGRQGQTRGLRTSGGNPIIPGSSLKGVYRARCAFILDAIGVDAEARRETLERLFGRAPEGPDDGTGRRGLLCFHDANITLTKDSAGKPHTIDYSHVAIDRISGGADDGKLFFVSAAPPGSRFTTTITADKKPTAADVALLEWVELDLHDGLAAVGGLTSRGYGTIKLTNDPPERKVLRKDAFGGAA